MIVDIAIAIVRHDTLCDIFTSTVPFRDDLVVDECLMHEVQNR